MVTAFSSPERAWVGRVTQSWRRKAGGSAWGNSGRATALSMGRTGRGPSFLPRVLSGRESWSNPWPQDRSCTGRQRREERSRGPEPRHVRARLPIVPTTHPDCLSCSELGFPLFAIKTSPMIQATLTPKFISIIHFLFQIHHREKIATRRGLGRQARSGIQQKLDATQR